jgi:LPPG:FO 2-phospho-L-lactate transferase
MKIVALAGGVGGARLLSGLARVVAPAEITAVVNTGDDFDWLGLRVCPDLDTVVYTLAGLANPATGWGVRDDSFAALDQLGRLGGPTWFRIGDRDLALHVLRTRALGQGQRLHAVTAAVCRATGVEVRVLPMSDDFTPTEVHTDEGTLPFQDYFVRRRAEPRVTGFTFAGIARARPAPGVLEAVAAAAVVVLCPSNPFISIGPILAVPGVRAALRAARGRVVAVSPIVAGAAVKGPAGRMLADLGMEVSATSVAALYRGLVSSFVLDRRDACLAESVAALGMTPRCAETVMDSEAARRALARAVLETVA